MNRNEKKLLALDLACIGIWEWHPLKSEIHFDQVGHKILGHDEDMPFDINYWLNRVNHDDISRCKLELKKSFKDKNFNYSFIMRVNSKTGKELYLLTTGKPTKFNSEGKVEVFLGTVQDITQSEVNKDILTDQLYTLKSMIKKLPSRVAMLDKNLNYICTSNKWNEGFEITYDLTGVNHYSVFTMVTEDIKKAIENAIVHGKSYKNEKEKYIFESGEIRFYKWEVTPWYTNNSEVGGIIILLEDITQIIDYEERLAKTQALAKIGYWDFILESQKINWSEEMYNIFPEKIEEGEPSFDKHKSTIHLEDQEIWEKTVSRSFMDGVPYSLKFRVVHPSKVVWVEARGEAKRNNQNKITSIYGTCQDITKEEINKQKLLRVNAELKTFSYRVSHDLKSPLTSIQGLIRMAKEEFTETQAPVIPYLNDIDSLCIELSETIENVLKVTEIENMTDEFSDVYIEKIKSSLKQKYNQQLEHKQFELKIEANIEKLFISKTRLYNILDNLISNSIKYFNPNIDSKIDLVFETKNGEYIITYKDNGIGIPIEHHEKVFTIFSQFHGHSKGNGLGLYMIKKQVDILKGTIIFDSDASGTSFQINIPILNY